MARSGAKVLFGDNKVKSHPGSRLACGTGLACGPASAFKDQNMELHMGIVAAQDAGHAGRTRTSRRMAWAWLASTLLLFWVLMPAARAASFNESFSSPPPGVPNSIGATGVASFQMTLGGEMFVFTAPTNAFVWEPGAGLLVNNSITQITIRRLDNNPFVLNTLVFNGDYGPLFHFTVRTLRNGTDAVPQRQITP